MPTLARVYHLSPTDVWNLTTPELDMFIKDLEANT